MTWPGNRPPELKRIFLIDFQGEGEAIARLLGVFVIQGCPLASLTLTTSAQARRLHVEVKGLDPERADQLGRRLEAIPFVRGVVQGWRAEPAEA